MHNIVELLRELSEMNVSIRFNNEASVLDARQYDKIIISPGPATPKESGNIIDIIQQLAPTHSILGICLGHQAIAEAFGGKLLQLETPHHGYQTDIESHKVHRIFNEINMPCKVGLYHSWTVDALHLPACLKVTSYSKDGHVMSLCHESYDVHGLQFHPESYMTECGKQMMANWLYGKS